jgi:hypothetical protein
MTSQLTLYNNALLLIGERSLASLSEAREVRRRLDAVWARPAIDDCLQRGQWNFAMRSVEINHSPSVTPSFGYMYAFDRPTDIIRTAELCGDEYFKVPLLAYQTEGAYYYSDTDPIYVRYVSNDSSYGADLSLWPQNFCRFFEAYLAESIVESVTQDASQWQKIRAILKDSLTQAKSTDSMEGPTEFPPTGSWVRARQGKGRGDRGRRNQLIG